MAFLEKTKVFVRREWAMLSTRLGFVLTAVSTVAPQYAAVNPMIGYAGFAAGVLLILWREDANG